MAVVSKNIVARSRRCISDTYIQGNSRIEACGLGPKKKQHRRCRKRRDKQNGKVNNSERINDKGLVQDDEQQPDNGLARGIGSLEYRGAVGGSTVKTADRM